jgi:uncharacterized protein
MRSARPAAAHVVGVAALLVAGAAAAVATAPGAAELSSIRVTGDAEVSARPDRVQIDIGVSTRAPRSQDAAAQNAREVDAVLGALRSAAGPAAQLKTVSYALNPNYQYHPNGAEPTLTGYTATNVVRVTLDDLAKLGGVIDAATRSGANQVQGVQFTLRDQDAARAQALRQAAIRARSEAEVLAAALNLRIVRVLTVEEASPRIVPVVRSFAAGRSAAAEVATPVEAGTLDIGSQVTLTVEVAPAAR